jgi:hypothetical protein
MEKEEVWKVVPHGEGYFVSNKGNIASEKTGTFKLRKLHENKYGYIGVILSMGNRNDMKHFLVHRLVAETFIENPENKPQVNHIDGDKKNNNVENLEWVTAKENTAHAYENNLKSYQQLYENGMKTAKEICQIDLNTGEVLKIWESAKAIQREIGFDQTAILRCCHLKQVTFKGFKWRFKDNIEAIREKKAPPSRNVDLIDKRTGDVIKTFSSADELSKYLNVNRNSVYRVINGHKNSIKGFKVKYTNV